MTKNTLTQTCLNYFQADGGLEGLSVNEVREQYNNLIKCIKEHNELYYTQLEPVISDYEYDQLFAYLQKIESRHPSLIVFDSPTQNLQDQLSVSEGFTKAEHTVPLLSLQNSYNAQDLVDLDAFIDRQLQKTQEQPNTAEKLIYSYIIEPKFDGISVELIYKDGILEKAITRGDGHMGEDITTNVSQIKNIPQKLQQTSKGILSLRGEILLPKSEFERINKERGKKKLNKFVNTRNAAAGTIKLLDPNTVKKRGLVCYIYDILQGEESLLAREKDQKNMYEILEEEHLPRFKRTKTVSSIGEVIKICEDQETFNYFQSQDIDFDGLVIKLNQFPLRALLGSTDHHPRWAMAYKFPAQKIAAQVEKINRQIGRTGVLTPVAHLTPVQLSGVTISRASLHNLDFITSKDIRALDRVNLQRSGEVIPYIVSVIKERRSTEGDVDSYSYPIVCPSCGTATSVNKESGTTQIHCPNNNNCPAQIIESLAHFVSKNCMDIDGLGEKYIKILVEEGLIRTPADIYTLHTQKRKLLTRPGFSTKRVEELTKKIESSKENSLRRLINALGLPGVGKKLAKILATEINRDSTAKEHTESAISFLAYLSNEDFLEEIPGIGKIIIEDLATWSRDPKNIRIMRELEAYKVFSLQEINEKTNINGTLAQQHFSMTGSFSLSRPEIVEILESHGAIFESAPTKVTNFMLVGEKPGSKAQKAEKLGITIYRTLDEITQVHPHIEFSGTKKDESNTPQMQSLFG